MRSKESFKAKQEAIEQFINAQQKEQSAEELTTGILHQNKVALAKSITLLESANPKHIEMAEKIVNACLPHSGKSVRIGITGVPGVGKSTFIEALGTLLTAKGKKVAVLAVDPSSSIHKGSILGDKTRMEKLATDKNAFVRPSPSSGALGGVANATRESIVLCEAAGFDIVIVETVGVGQSEYLVKDMVDFFLLLALSGAGDEIQGIKRGIMEMTDALFVNKADGSNIFAAKEAEREYANALHLFPPREDEWIPKTGVCSAIQLQGIETVWSIVLDFVSSQNANGWFVRRRQLQSKYWLMKLIDSGLRDSFYNDPNVAEQLPRTIQEVIDGNTTPYLAAKAILKKYKNL